MPCGEPEWWVSANYSPEQFKGWGEDWIVPKEIKTQTFGGGMEPITSKNFQTFGPDITITPMPGCKVSVYIDNSIVYEYAVNDPMSGREHAAAIIATGYRHTCPNGDLEWFPPHRIIKVKVSGGGESTKYKDNMRAT